MAQTDPLNHTATTVYDAVGNVIAARDALNNATTFSYDALHRLTAVTQPSGGIFTTAYDAASNVIASVDALGNRTTLVYDALNRAIAEVDALNGRTTVVFDAAGNRTVVIDPLNNRTTYSYDALNRVTQETDPLNRSATFAYDANSRMTSTTDRIGRRRHFSYDAMSQLKNETWVNVGGGTANTFTYTYDPSGNLLTAADADGSITFTYDALDRTATSKDLFNVALTFSYDANSNRTQVQDSFGGLTTSTFDAADRLTGRKYTGQGATLRYDYGYSDRDEMIGITRYSDLAGLSKVGATSFSYDTTGRLQNLKHQNAAGSWFHNATMTYDTANRITVETLNATPKTFSYDNTNQLTNDSSSAYSYDANGNRTMSGYQTGTGNQLTNDGTWTYSYDNEGNRTKKSKGALLETWTYGYDHDNRLVWVEQRASDGGTLQLRVDYKYDALGRRIERTADTNGDSVVDTTERFSYDGADVIADLNASNGLVTRRLYGGAAMAAPEARVSSAGTVAWYMADRLGSIVALSDAAGVVQSQVTYDGFGKILTESNPSFGDRFKYTGQELDSATTLQHHDARYYDPTTGRWTSRDPIGFNASDANLYRYVRNNSTNWIDPSGLEEKPSRLGGRAAVQLDPTIQDMDAWLRDAKAAEDFLAANGRNRDLERLRDLVKRVKDVRDSIADGMLKEERDVLDDQGRREIGQMLEWRRRQGLDQYLKEMKEAEERRAAAAAAQQKWQEDYEKWLVDWLNYVEWLEKQDPGGLSRRQRESLPKEINEILARRECQERQARQGSIGPDTLSKEEREKVERERKLVAIINSEDPHITEGARYAASIELRRLRGESEASIAFGPGGTFDTLVVGPLGGLVIPPGSAPQIVNGRKELHRPYIRKDVRAEAERRAPRTADGRPIDPNTFEPIEGKPDLGHVRGREFWRERAKAEREGLTQKEFNDRMNNPDFYQLENPSSNRSHRFEKPK